MSSEDDTDFILRAKKIIVNKTALCVAGGGVLGVGEVGALRQWIEHGGDLKKITHIVGASVGGILASIIANGGSIEYIQKTFDGLDLRKFQDGPNVFIKCYNFFKKFGWYAGDTLHDMIGNIMYDLTGNSEITMKESFERYGVRLTIVYNSLNFKDAFYIDHITEPNTKVKDAVRMGAGYPLYYNAIFRRYLNAHGVYANNVIIDGGTIDNYPLHVLRDQGVDDSQILGLKLCSSDEIKEYKEEIDIYSKDHYDFGEPGSLIDFTLQLIDLLRTAAMKVHVKNTDWILTAKINVSNLNSTDFAITKEQLRDIFEAGEISIDQLIADTALLLKKGEYPIF